MVVKFLRSNTDQPKMIDRLIAGLPPNGKIYLDPTYSEMSP